MILRLLRRLLSLPARRCSSWYESEWVAMRDGVRLHTLHVWPIDLDGEAPTVVVRTPYGTRDGLGLAALTGRLLAESGYHVVVQDVRGRYASEGRFTPFVNEANDGQDTLAWALEQPWCNGSIGLFGGSYLAYCAWTALARAPGQVQAISVAIGSGDLQPVFHPGGAFALSLALEWGLGVGDRESVPRRQIDLARGLAHRPTREADRVALRVVDWYRDWIDHPANDGFWRGLEAKPRGRPPAALLIAGWYDFFLAPQLADHARVEVAAREHGAVGPRLVIGPWSHGLPARTGLLRHGMQGLALRETIAHFDAHLRKAERDRSGSAQSASAVRYFSLGEDAWHDAPCWPPPSMGPRKLYLRGGGALDWDAPQQDETPDRYAYDPAAPTPTRGGALFGLKGGARDQRAIGRRSDVLVYETSPLEADVDVAGPVTLVLHAASDAEDVDFTAKLCDVSPDGRARNLCDGIARRRWLAAGDASLEPRFLEPGLPFLVEVELGSTAARFRIGHRIRLEIASANFPRFDRNSGSRSDPARVRPAEARTTTQTIFHEVARPSHLVLPLCS